MALDPYDMAMQERRRLALRNISEMRGAAGMPVDPAQRAALLQSIMPQPTPPVTSGYDSLMAERYADTPQDAARKKAMGQTMLVGRGVHDALPFPMQTGGTKTIRKDAAYADKVREMAGRVEAERLQDPTAKGSATQQAALRQKTKDTREARSVANLAKWRALGRLPETPETYRQHHLDAIRAANPSRVAPTNPEDQARADLINRINTLPPQIAGSIMGLIDRGVPLTPEMIEQLSKMAQMPGPPMPPQNSRYTLPNGTVYVGPPGQQTGFGMQNFRDPSVPFGMQ